MKKLILLLLFIPLVSFGQSLRDTGIDFYKYLVIEQTNYPNTRNTLLKELGKAGYNVIDITKEFPSDLDQNPNLALYVSTDEKCSGSCEIAISLLKSNDDVFWISKTYSGGIFSKKQLKLAIGPLVRYNYNYNPSARSSKEKLTVDFKSEESIRNWLDKNATDPIEGIWVFSNEVQGNYFKGAILKLDDEKFTEIIMECYGKEMKKFCASLGNFGSGIGFVKKMASESVYVFSQSGISASAILKGNTIEVFYPKNNGGKTLAIKEYPNKTTLSKKKLKTGEWAGNGSGVIISKSGYIITNHHVINDADDIEVEFILNDEVQKFNAEIVQVDKTNDLAILKIFDMNFDGVDELPYNFKTRSSDVGTKVYAFGYPMALSIMGKEMKVTDGMISSKTGFDGNITTYQITAPIQGGNSGGPLFDEKGNLIGINSSGIRKDIADNVAYSIKTSYVLNLIDILPKSIELPSNTKLESLTLTEQIKEISKYVVLIKVK